MTTNLIGLELFLPSSAHHMLVHFLCGWYTDQKAPLDGGGRAPENMHPGNSIFR